MSRLFNAVEAHLVSDVIPSPEEAMKVKEDLVEMLKELEKKMVEEPEQWETWQLQKKRGNELLKRWTAYMRKIQVLSAREKVIGTGPKKGIEKAPHVAVNQSLKRTQQSLALEMQRAAAVQARMGEGKAHLQQSNEKYTQLNGELMRTRKLLTELKIQAEKDRLWIAAGIGMLIFAVTIVVVERLPVVGFIVFMESPDVEEMIESFRRGKAPQKTLDRIIAQDIQELDEIIVKSRHSSPRRVRTVSPMHRALMTKYEVPVEDNIASMLLERKPVITVEKKEAVPIEKEIQVNMSTADIIRKAAVDIDREMAHALASFQSWEESRAKEHPEETENKQPELPLSAITIATELEAAFEMMNKRAKELIVPEPPKPAPQPPAPETIQAKSFVQGNAITSQKELDEALERLDRATEAAAATFPKLEHLIQSQAITDDEELRGILERLDQSTISKPQLFPENFHSILEPEMDYDDVFHNLERIKQTAYERTAAIEEALHIQDFEKPNQDNYQAHIQYEPKEESYSSSSEEEEVPEFLENLSVKSRDIVEELSVAMYTLRHRLDIDAKEQQDRQAKEQHEKEKKAKALAEAEAAKRKAEQEKIDMNNAKERVMGMSLYIGNDEIDDDVSIPSLKPVGSGQSYLQRLKPFESINVLERFDALVPPHLDNQCEHDYEYDHLQPTSREPKGHAKCYCCEYQSPRERPPVEYNSYRPSAYTSSRDYPTKRYRKADYSGLSIDELREARERKQAWLYQPSL
ncbi:hypothetical protein THRCLA_01454 [Thraustotheca clavata]|uniref:Sec20 C-terminal domain-containing protein n=1 Tax=Thraustotheca clavata TaxID=74557 RepID=A0A1W0A8A3_9STRA|nr:hypothetical protein THRCLA_01454 [Thraustotheca clavata]